MRTRERGTKGGAGLTVAAPRFWSAASSSSGLGWRSSALISGGTTPDVMMSPTSLSSTSTANVCNRSAAESIVSSKSDCSWLAMSFSGDDVVVESCVCWAAGHERERESDRPRLARQRQLEKQTGLPRVGGNRAGEEGGA